MAIAAQHIVLSRFNITLKHLLQYLSGYPLRTTRRRPMSTILIVEDEERLRATLTYNLRKASYDVQAAASGPETGDSSPLCLP